MKSKSTLKPFKYIVSFLLITIVTLFTLYKFHTYYLKKKAIYIPYQDACGQPNKELVIITINQLEKVKKLKDIYFKQKLCNKNKVYFTLGYGIFDKDTLSKYQIAPNDFVYKQNNENYKIEISITNKSIKYLGFQFGYKNTFCKGLNVEYMLFYDSSKELEQIIGNYKYTKKLEDNWYFTVVTTIDTDSEIFDNTFISRDTNKKWEYVTPPLQSIIQAYDVDLINQWIINNR